MKKISCLLILVLLLVRGAAAMETDKDKKIEKYKNITVRNIKILSNALELYANDHYREYPSEKVFRSKAFQKYILKALGKKKADTSAYYKCPPGETLKYSPSKKILAFKLSCPKPEMYKLKALYFSSREGFVLDDGTPKTKTTAKIQKRAKWEPVTDSEKEEMTEVIKKLYGAYSRRDLEGVMDIEKEAIVREGMRLEKMGKYTAIEVYYAFKGTANDLFRAEGFGMKPLNLKSVKFRKKGNLLQAFSPSVNKPIIATNRVSVGTMKVSLYIGLFEFERVDGKLRIVKMQLY